MPNKLRLLFLLPAAALILSGCSVSFGGGTGNSSVDGGIFRSANKGDNWLQKTLIPTTTGKPRSFSGLNVMALAMDPNDNRAVYVGTQDNGLFYTYDTGENWFYAGSLAKMTIRAVAVDPKNKCVVYASAGNRVYKSIDCNRTWAQVFFDNDLNLAVNAVAVDHYNANNVYIGTSRGEVVKSFDAGKSWQTVSRLKDKVGRILISPHDSRIIIAATSKNGLFRSTNEGEDWVDLREKFKDIKDGTEFKDIVMSKAEPGHILLSSKLGLMQTNDYGDTWQKLNLITPEKTATINAIAVSQKNIKEIYYATNTTFYRSLDGGQNWTTKKLPTTRAGWKLLIDPEDAFLYVGVKSFKDENNNAAFGL